VSAWRIEETPGGMRLGSVVRRTLGAEELNWADLLLLRLDAVQVLALYFPSRLDRPEDESVKNTLLTFARNTGTATSVNFWDTKDPEFSRALGFFDVKTPPALVLARGLATRRQGHQLSKEHLYAIAITQSATLSDTAHLGQVINSAHEVLVRGDAKEISGYLRERKVDSLLTAIRKLGSDAVDQLLTLRPKFQLPGGVSMELGR